MTTPEPPPGEGTRTHPLQGTRTVVVVPCFNEARRLPTAEFLGFLQEDPSVGFLFVDDGSSDGTREVLEDLRRQAGRGADVLALSENVGKAEAVRRGVVAALARDPEAVGYWDADLATSLAELSRMRDVLLADPHRLAVLGSRVRLLGRRIERSALRHYAGRVFATVASLKLRLPVYDTQCGAKLFRAVPETRAAFDAPFSSRWIFDVEILARLTRALGAAEVTRRLVEHPLDAWEDVGGSKLRPSSALRAGIQLLRLRA